MRRVSVILLAHLTTVALGAFVFFRPDQLRGNSGSSPAEESKTEYALRPIPFSAVHRAHRAAPHLRNQNGTSQNWSGYAVETSLSSPQNGAVSAVAGQWTVPTVSASGSAYTYSSIWVGIDGYSDGTVEQIGTEQDWTPSGQQNYVWFEMYPKAAFEIVGFPIAPGDVFSASVSSSGNGAFVLTIVNETQNSSYTVPSRYTRARNAQRSSAEWIVEAPYSGGILPLADFGSVSFSNCAATVNGQTGPINDSSWQYDAISMQTPAGITKAQVSKLKGGSAFSVTWKHE